MFPLIFGIIAGALGAVSSFSQGMAQASQMRQQSAVLEAQAQAQRQQANIDRQTAEIEASRIGQERSKLTAQYRRLQARNTVRAGAGNVDIASGSAYDIALGNANLYAADVGNNAYQQAMRLWQGNEAANRAEYQANVMDGQSSWLSRTASQATGPTILNSLLTGATGFLSGYGLAGGSMKSLFGTGVNAAKYAKEGEAAQAAFHSMVYRY